MRKIFFILFLIGCNIIFSQTPDENMLKGLNSINREELMKSVSYLASDELRGRLSGSQQYFNAADYTAKQFLKAGLIPANNGSFFQYFFTEYNEISDAKFGIVKENKIFYYKHGTDFSCRGFSGSGIYTSPVVFCGYGISESCYDDYKDVEVNGKIVLIFKQNADWNTDTKEKYSSLRVKSEIAYNKGALATLFVPRPNDKNPQKPIGSVMDGEGQYISNHPMLQIDIKVADEILENTGYTLSQLQSKIDESRLPNSLNTKANAYLEVNAKYDPARNTMNVAAILEGNDPILKNEYVIIGAHLDHVGSQGNVIYNGANDNASGSAAVLQIARAFSELEIKPKRSILFLLFSNEESGLHGAYHYVNNPLVPLENTIAMLNLDCVSNGDSIMVGNGLSAPELWNIANEMDSLYIKMMVKNTWKGGGADATPFFEKGIQCLYFVTTNGYEHLHLPTDDTETLKPELFEKITLLAYLTAYRIAND
ncbi:MAG: M20/M25/M40 family metallo-hydrolase [Ignavibacteria bacterium]|nr:M20/M25/M40 family metallo-hydrolase [Ignavibacteria bacterium]